jgi:hypothetical protein
VVAAAPDSHGGRGPPQAPGALPDASDARPRSPWIWGRSIDLAVFGGSAALALVLVGLSSLLADEGGTLPPWGWLIFVVAVDVAHVHTTLFRTYFDRDELRRRRALYIGVPIACYAAGLGLHLISHLAFWRALAYLAVLHFIRQQIGWVAIYRARAGERSKLDRWLDDAVIYFATGWPLLHWHANLPRSFRWFIEGDFVALPLLAGIVRPLGVVYVALLVAYAARSVVLAARSGFARVNTGKHVVVATTAATWYVGIVATNTDFQFTVANVIVHGVPYMALLFAYARERSRDAPRVLSARIVAFGVTAFLGVALALAFAEEVLWDRLVWHDRPFWFGGGERDTPLLGPLARALIVPLLALPQATHYALDAVLWRRRDTGLAQARALGFRAAPPQRPTAISPT